MVYSDSSDPALVRALIESQFPEWSHYAVEAVESTGTANYLYRLGDEMVVRISRSSSAMEAVEKEHRWLPELASQLPLALPIPLAQGRPVEECPRPWSVYAWLEGEDGWTRPLTDLDQAASDLAAFIAALQRVDSADGPRPGEHNCFRGVPLQERDASVRSAIEELGNRVDRGAVEEVWDSALRQPLWRDDVWIHGDLQPGNLLSRNGKLTAVIDFGLLGVGDPAADLLPAWNLLERDSRDIFRGALEVDDATWIRGQGWALYQALLALPFYWSTNPTMVRMSQRVIGEILGDRIR